MKKASVQSNERMPRGWSSQQIAVEFNHGILEVIARQKAGQNIRYEHMVVMPEQRVTIDEGKISKEELNYQSASNSKSVCANCRYFKGVNTMECNLVSGLIEPQDTCSAWDPGFKKVKEYKDKNIVLYEGSGFMFSVQVDKEDDMHGIRQG
ncbi:MAG: hypothetical protein HY361_01570 [Candidatus Aenigmarchaeota archaeon]|nr:hypothetical protein [Candidatus Aenigmarchaeota archaeon]